MACWPWGRRDRDRDAIDGQSHPGAISTPSQQYRYVEVRGGARARLSVGSWTKEDGSEGFDILAQIEAHCGSVRCDVDGCAPPALHELRTLNVDRRHAAAADKRGPSLYFDLDATFHRRYVEASGGHRIIVLPRAIEPQADRYAQLYTSVLPDTIRTSVHEHDAIDEGSPDDSQRAVEAVPLTRSPNRPQPP